MIPSGHRSVDQAIYESLSAGWHFEVAAPYRDCGQHSSPRSRDRPVLPATLSHAKADFDSFFVPSLAHRMAVHLSYPKKEGAATSISSDETKTAPSEASPLFHSRRAVSLPNEPGTAPHLNGSL